MYIRVCQDNIDYTIYLGKTKEKWRKLKKLLTINWETCNIWQVVTPMRRDGQQRWGQAINLIFKSTKIIFQKSCWQGFEKRLYYKSWLTKQTLLRKAGHEVIFGCSEARRSKATKAYMNGTSRNFTRSNKATDKKDECGVLWKLNNATKNHAHMIQARWWYCFYKQ